MVSGVAEITFSQRPSARPDRPVWMLEQVPAVPRLGRGTAGQHRRDLLDAALTHLMTGGPARRAHLASLRYLPEDNQLRRYIFGEP